MEITFQNKSEDLDAFYDYLLAQTPEGIRLGKYGFQDKQRWIFIDSALLGTVVWGAMGNGVLAIVAALGFFIFMEFLFLLFAGFKPHYFYGKKIYKSQESLLTPKDLQIIQLKRTLTADEDWLEVRSSEAMHRWRWRRVDRIGRTANFFYIHVGNCPVVYVPKRDFPSEESFIEFGNKLVDLKEKYKDQPFGAE